jgi:hypothetical protein
MAKRERKRSSMKKTGQDADGILRDAEIIARWAKKPFYIS